MPKVSKVGRNRAKAASAILEKPNTDDGSNSEKGATATQSLSRGQRKRMQKRDQYLKRERMVLSTLKLKKIEEQKSRIDGLDAIKEALSSTIQKSKLESNVEAEESEEKKLLKSNKSKKEVAQKELNHLNLVLQHPSFQTNPFATMQEHLRNSFAKQAEEQEKNAEIERKENAKKAEEKKEARKERIRNAKYEKSRRGKRRNRM
ncbi:hypothetical protein CTEN210_07577 [Chaetoceros tenuissimus]|uniref:Uncharacterized protein n=1 Tax=Chaetoceros tenuissimus TaxID=426638 RepID=A0AAD3CRZ4_9STRA|nr:hypothetical protein CTEN210_07577 [Chaetoceros tenuissimus]